MDMSSKVPYGLLKKLAFIYDKNNNLACKQFGWTVTQSGSIVMLWWLNLVTIQVHHWAFLFTGVSCDPCTNLDGVGLCKG